MASTFWGELYFRSLKRNKVLILLTKYLLQKKQVCIPHVGTFELIQLSPEWNVADKLFSPPVFFAQYSGQDNVPAEQLRYLSSAQQEDDVKLQQQLNDFGKSLKERVQSSPFEWNGFGTLSYDSNKIIFTPQTIESSALQPIPAQRVIRQHAEHMVLVGDQEMTAQQLSEVLHPAEKKRSIVLLIGWVILILAILAIIYFLYIGHFSTGAAGLKTHAANQSTLHHVLY
jgi:hypothetical protein